MLKVCFVGPSIFVIPKYGGVDVKTQVRNMFSGVGRTNISCLPWPGEKNPLLAVHFFSKIHSWLFISSLFLAHSSSCWYRSVNLSQSLWVDSVVSCVTVNCLITPYNCLWVDSWFKRFTRIVALFEEIHNAIAPRIHREDTNYRTSCLQERREVARYPGFG